METITVRIGTTVGMSNGRSQDRIREVEFVGERLGDYTEYGYSTRGGGLTDTRGVTQTLYRTEDGRLVVYVKDWSHWQGEPNVYSLHEVSEEDLGVNGKYEDLGCEAGFGRPLTIDEALGREAGLGRPLTIDEALE